MISKAICFLLQYKRVALYGFYILGFSSSVIADNTSSTTNSATFVASTGVSSTQIVTQVSNVHPIVGEQTVLRFELLVNGFFNGGTEFDLPSMSSARLSQASAFAINGSRTIAGQALSSQIWEVYLYPEHKGVIEVPSVRFKIKYMDSSSGEPKTATLMSDAVALYAHIPASLKDVKQYIVTESVSIDEQWSEPQQSYNIGDVIKREINISVTNLPAMNIPRIGITAPNGINVMALEAKLTDSNNRGENSAILSQEFSYIIEAGGEFTVGGEEVVWWQPDGGLHRLNLAEIKLKVIGANANRYRMLFALVGFVLVIMVLLGLSKLTLPIRVKLTQALLAGDWRQFINLMYQRGDLISAPVLIKPSLPLQAPYASTEVLKKHQLISQLFKACFSATAEKDNHVYKSKKTAVLSVKKAFMFLIK
ncbi:BatD family protein [Shewanella gelidimarina]|uniref:BatD family protein n=1 Tax=Shewanella gelidimarina TaxID=56813 RepID=UPI00200F0C5F|nr:BatD family protein [Shewanella gelidimarina]MCL1058911.1 BatD family protein [Shewanella gelidimarina]